MLVLKKIKKSKKKLLLIALATVLVIGLAGGGYYLYHKITTKDQTQTPGTSTINYGPPTQEEKDQGEQSKFNRIQKSTQQPAKASDGTAAISSIAQDASKNLVVQTNIQATAPTTCDLTLTYQSYTVSKTAKVLFQPDFSTCEGFSIPASEFSAAGVWSASLTVTTSDGSHITSPSTQINIIK